MERNQFIKLTSLSIGGVVLDFRKAKLLLDQLGLEEYTFPAMFIGHGNPMNAIEDNEFSKEWKRIGQELPTPKAILCVSAHWETKGSYVTAMNNPETIHDFSGFPKELHDVHYRAPGDLNLAKNISESVDFTNIMLDHDWGLDHGTWSILNQMYPSQSIPVLQLSLDRGKGAEYHYELASHLSYLRKKGVLIIGSGNMIHNIGASLKMVNQFGTWDKKIDWAEELNSEMRDYILSRNHKALISFRGLKNSQLAIPTNEHYLPMLYILGLQQPKESVKLFNDQTFLAMSMTSFIISSN